MGNLLLVAQIIVSVFLIGAILIQTKGTGFGRVWGSSGVSFARRGLEKLVFRLTFVLAGLFTLLAVLQLVIS
ncbi:MAG: preprotein translocase subunit SecG [Patescibacteria group bacterium]